MKRRRPPQSEPSRERAAADEAMARHVAHILGDQSAAALSLAELKRRRDAGLESFVVELDGSFWVGNWPKVSAVEVQHGS